MPNLLLLGGHGIVGRHFIRKIRALSPSIICESFSGDIRSSADLSATISHLSRVDLVVNLAAVVEVSKVQDRPDNAYFVNAFGVLNILRSLIEVKQQPYFFQCSTSHVYAPCSVPVSESSRTEPHTVYGRTKLMGEILARDICCANDIPFCIGRLFSIHDPEQTGSYLRPNIVRRLREEDLSKPFELAGADSIRDFLTAEDAAELIARLVLKRAEGVVNVASGRAVKIRDFVQSLSERKLEIVSKGVSNTLVADTRLLTSILGSSAAQD
ncbi:NAD-dependent epimerase/dehydratase family protein [Stappia sp. BW2]|uniref:NAD-dependent epimerase/dehydratase family protein n=1 Tax=Stappia sp. BW2 TaxID=2592622 RepID=UPI0011DEF6CE|nr:GDP-mannose 4,6-dehydratase [Stappia sp. BW2]TYC79828.1 NAD-dependent epimerase/dehydratase family protein [Stappia sp. BW2]